MGKVAPPSGKKLSLTDAVAMAIGGMVGGGIFAVLGEAVTLSGNAAFLGFALAGLLALITGMSYSRLTLSFDEPGGSFTYVEHLAGPGVAGTLSWFLILGYFFTISLYAYAFGTYAGAFLGLKAGLRGFLGMGIIAVFALVNLAGVRSSGITEDLLVYLKVGILLVIGGISLQEVSPSQALPVFEHSPISVVTAAALIFVAYEGFELLTFDYDDIQDKHRNLPRAVWISIPVVIFIYVLVSFVTAGSLPDPVIVAHSETVLAEVARPVLGRIGFITVLVAAVISTASAINATMFATARLANRVAGDLQLPPVLTVKEVGGVPVIFIAIMSGFAAVTQFFGGLHQITTFASLVFLVVYSVVNLAALVHSVFQGFWRFLPVVGTLGCLSAALTLLHDLYTKDTTSLMTIAGIAVLLLGLRIPFVLWHSGYAEKH